MVWWDFRPLPNSCLNMVGALLRAGSDKRQVASAPKLVYRFCRSAQGRHDRQAAKWGYLMEMLLLLREVKTRGAGRVLFASVLGGAALALSGCSVSQTLDTRETLTQGYVMDEDAIELVPVGSSREQVMLALGTPSTTATFDNEVFYYISQTRVRNAAFMKPKIVDQRVLAVYFGDD